MEYHAAYYDGEDGWVVAMVLDFPGANSQGKTLRSARHMLRDALRLMAETHYRGRCFSPTFDYSDD